MTDWYERGKKDNRQNVPRVAAPSTEADINKEWWRGWDDAEAEDKQASLEIADVALLLRDGRLHLIDGDGRVLGSQTGVVAQQDEEGLSASVSFVGLSIKTA